MILYFTGTGNSKFVANALADELNDEVVSLNTIIKESKKISFVSSKPFIVVTPIYGWRIPQIVNVLLKSATFSGNNHLYFLGTMGGQSGNSEYYCKKICNQNGMKFMGFGNIKMPNNYVVAKQMPDQLEINVILHNALTLISSYASQIKQNLFITKNSKDHSPLPWLRSGPVNFLYNKLLVSSKNYVVSDDCISCGKCDRICPTNNITLKSGKPYFGNSCINCYACIHHCPRAAINVKGRTETNGRYVCPEYKEGEILLN